MGFQQALSGLSAASQSLDVIGNNIANANTTGMKSSTAEFSNIYATALGSSTAGTGGGVQVTDVAQSFTQGAVNADGNPLNVAINNNGFFQLALANGSSAYTRDGSFHQNVSGNIVTASGAQLLGIAPDPTTGAILPGGKLVPLTLPSGTGIPAVATTAISGAMNLDATAVASTGSAITTPPTLVPPLATYGTSVTAYDGQGVPIPVSLYFTKTGLNTWQPYTNDLSGTVPAGPPVALGAPMVFDPASGNLAATVGVPAVPNPWLSPVSLPMASVNGALATAPTLDLSKVSQYGTGFAVSSLSQNGQTSGKLTSVSIDATGVVMGSYDNGKQVAAGQIQLATFANNQGLSPISGNMWLSSPASGTAVSGSPGSGNFGALSPSSLESSNVDLTSELVNLMTAQRSYQANAQTIKTQDQVMSTLVNLR